MFKKRSIKVAFICQWKHGYVKFQDVVLKMRENDKFDVQLIVFSEDVKNSPENSQIDFWESNFPKIKIIEAKNSNGWYDLKKSYNPDYVFVQRPYDIYLPEEYSLSKLSKIAKVCYIPYAYIIADFRAELLNKEILSNIYIYFAENEEQYQYAKMAMGDLKGKHYSYNLGYPYLDRSIKNAAIPKSAFLNTRPKNEKRIIWTPRWTMDKDFCASTFFNYKDKIVDYFKKNRNLQLVFRPHPLMFGNFIEKGLMKEAEVKEYLKNFTENMYYDEEANYLTTFKDADILITDFSSIIIDFLILNKPIILCGNDDETKYFKIMKKISKASYKAKNWKEVQKILDDLSKGIDNKQSNRKKIINEIIDQNDGNVSMKIVKSIIDDYYN